MSTIPWYLGGQAGAESSAKVYWNKETQVVYVDAAGLPEPQRNGVSGLGSKTKSFNTTSIGLLDKFDKTINVFLLLTIQEMQKPSNYIRTCRRKFKPYNGTIIYLRKV
jgi:hypothetical protein